MSEVRGRGAPRKQQKKRQQAKLAKEVKEKIDQVDAQAFLAMTLDEQAEFGKAKIPPKSTMNYKAIVETHSMSELYRAVYFSGMDYETFGKIAYARKMSHGTKYELAMRQTYEDFQKASRFEHLLNIFAMIYFVPLFIGILWAMYQLLAYFRTDDWTYVDNVFWVLPTAKFVTFAIIGLILAPPIRRILKKDYGKIEGFKKEIEERQKKK